MATSVIIIIVVLVWLAVSVLTACIAAKTDIPDWLMYLLVAPLLLMAIVFSWISAKVMQKLN